MTGCDQGMRRARQGLALADAGRKAWSMASGKGKAMRSALWMAAVVLFGLLSPLPALAGPAGEAVFAQRGPWTDMNLPLEWSLHVDGPEANGFLTIRDGRIGLDLITDPSDGQPALQLSVTTDSRTRKIGPFPVSGGDPVLTYFLEQTTRDMARLTGGSPYYIRNRIKDALFRGGETEPDGAGLIARFQPFADDRNADRMRGFQTLTLTFRLEDEPSRPIREMRAQTQGELPGYDQHLVLK